MSFWEKVFVVVVTPFLVFLAYSVFVWTPVSLYAEAECLRNGYLKAKVSVGLERYCTTLDGAVTVTVEKQ